jgi:DNA-binding NtrC family response regulator
VRELRNVIERAVLLADGETIDMPHLPEGLGPSEKKSADAVATLTLPLGITIDEAEKTLILQSLKLTGHNKTRAAGILGINVKTLHNKLTRYLASGATDTKGGA